MEKFEENEQKKVSAEQLKKILNKNGNNYTDEEVEKIREFLYLLAHIELEHIKRQKEESTKVITLRSIEYKIAS
ncbi:MAG: hypothetical protein HYR91_15545 [Flavobacteriia bacterium]|nr:hypothetical protein [Flavobacteriia bacterium]